MPRHFIIMSSSYTDGMRIALDFIGLTNDVLSEKIELIRRKCGADVPLSTHFIETLDSTWKSVIESDSFFEGVCVVDTVDDFIEKIIPNRTILGIDVARYILSKIQCTHLKLEKLAYLCYADFLCRYGKPLFEDKIYAFQYGPVVESVYAAFKGRGSEAIDDESILSTGVPLMPVKSRILFACGGIDKLNSIDATLSVYGRYTPGQLVDITHKEGAPWTHIDCNKKFEIIPDDIIRKYHSFESCDR